jgi:hypothetical protein
MMDDDPRCGYCGKPAHEDARDCPKKHFKVKTRNAVIEQDEISPESTKKEKSPLP